VFLGLSNQLRKAVKILDQIKYVYLIELKKKECLQIICFILPKVWLVM
jgi:hypothetical protein